MAPKKTKSSSSSSLSPSSPIPIGNCEVTVESNNFSTCKSDPNILQISTIRNAQIKISVREELNIRCTDHIEQSKAEEETLEAERIPIFGDEYMFVLVNSKYSDNCSKCYLQEILNIYTRELPTMNYAANTGKQSMFLEKCISNGKYCSLLLKSKLAEGSGVGIAAITYQIVPADTQVAEIPLAAVSSEYQRKGFGCLLYKELRKRLWNVGVRSIYCWGDKESEGFWHKLGFESIAEVDKKGRARRLPIKADIRRALCFPGGSILMVSHINHNIPGFHWSGNCEKPGPFGSLECSKRSTDLGLEKIGADIDAKCCSCYTQGKRRKAWEASLSSLKTKKVKGCHLIDCETEYTLGLDSGSDRMDSCFDGCSLAISKGSSFMEVAATDPLTSRCMENNDKEDRPTHMESEVMVSKGLQSKDNSIRIMLMNIADDTKKNHLTKVIDNLGGAVTPDGNGSTHVITGEVRKTLNFCIALCSGAWIVSSSWLKESFRKGRFIDESPHMLHDEAYKLKYKTELREAVLRAKARPNALLKGYDICISTHVQPPVGTLCAIVKSAGGNIISGLDKVKESSKMIFVACEEDMEEALSAAKAGIPTFSSDWLMNCIMRQELDLQALQFAESL